MKRSLELFRDVGLVGFCHMSLRLYTSRDSVHTASEGIASFENYIGAVTVASVFGKINTCTKVARVAVHHRSSSRTDLPRIAK